MRKASDDRKREKLREEEVTDSERSKPPATKPKNRSRFVFRERFWERRDKGAKVTCMLFYQVSDITEAYYNQSIAIGVQGFLKKKNFVWLGEKLNFFGCNNLLYNMYCSKEKINFFGCDISCEPQMLTF